MVFQVKQKFVSLGLAGRLAVGVIAIQLAAFLALAGNLSQAWLPLLAWGAMVALAACLGLAWFVHCTLHRPLASLLEAARAMAAGDYERPVAANFGGEIGQLAASLESMRRSVRQNTEDLKESRRRFQTLFEQAPCHISVQDRNLRLLAFNKLFEDDFGASKGAYCYQVYKGRSGPCPVCAVDKAFQDGQSHSAEETVLGKDGKPRHFLNLTAPIFDNQGRVTSVMEMATDITPLRALEDELKASEEKYRLFFDIDPNPLFVFERENFQIVQANRRAVEVYGRPKEELAGLSFLLLAPPDQRQALREFLDSGESLSPRLPQLTGQGRRFYVNLRVARLYSGGRRAIIASADDLTDSLQAEQQLVQAAKMATLGEMSAGVAHELNQPLTVMGAAASYISKQLARGREIAPERLAEVAAEVTGQVERARRIIDHLRAFGRKGEVERERVDLNQPVQAVLGLVGRQLQVHDITLHLELAQSLPLAWAQGNRLEQVFINLLLNARDAIEERLAGEPGSGQGEITIKTWAGKGRVWARVADNGPGMPPEVAEKVFDPFFTTKEVGKGTGLGLSISYGILRDFGGGIEVAGNPGQGARFTLWLPTAREEEA